MNRRSLIVVVVPLLLAAVAMPASAGGPGGPIATTAVDQVYRTAGGAPVRTPLVGGVTLSQTLPGLPVTVSLWGSLATPDWECFQNVSAATPPTVVCDDAPTDHTLTTWYCDQFVIDALAGLPTSRVRGQGSCDGTQTAVAPRAIAGGTMSTAEVATTALPPVLFDYIATYINLDTHTFVCQAWGPANTPVPIAPWSVECNEP